MQGPFATLHDILRAHLLHWASANISPDISTSERSPVVPAPGSEVFYSFREGTARARRREEEGVWGLGFGVSGLKFKGVLGLGFRVLG